MENQDILKETPLFSCLSEQEFSEIKKIAVEKTFQRNYPVIQEEDIKQQRFMLW